MQFRMDVRISSLHNGPFCLSFQLDRNRQGNTDRGREIHEFVRQAQEKIEVSKPPDLYPICSLFEMFTNDFRFNYSISFMVWFYLNQYFLDFNIVPSTFSAKTFHSLIVMFAQLNLN